MCCPPGYYLAHSTKGEVVGDCLSNVAGHFSGVFAYIDDGSVWSVSTGTVTDLTTVGAVAVIGWNIRQTPETASTSPTLSSPTTESLSSTSTPTTSSATSSPTSTGGWTSGLPRGAAVGIGVGVGLGVVGLASLIASFILIRRRKRKREGEINGDSTLPGVVVEGKPAVGVPHGNMDQPGPSEAGNDGAIRASELHSEDREYQSVTPSELHG
ncbi:hypothetical protein KVR01_002278 [Diaporthe batatas]|uniref:uncharacterized protein n=1 Tax=Diaporthe batatas TaxID=748121 RepID=UPI001D044A02|nr:uncharacterized protein KVR01_002278 [Diaporthe batatas]KAG8166589.1 hypothetical protein KVR01_002278 [Diaporthe batatas]